MNNIQEIKTGNDPRVLPEFSAIREESNKASHPSQPELNWKLVESLALTIFKNNGVDLHTATYYTLARTRLHGLAGFCEGVELLAALVNHEWDKFWPQAPQARTEMLDWFNTRIGNILRQQLSYSKSDLPRLYRTERALQLICDKLQQVELSRIPRVENLLYFIQNTRKRQETPQENTVSSSPSTLVYIPNTVQHDEQPLSSDIKVEVHPGMITPQPAEKKISNMIKGFLSGIAFSTLIALLFGWWQVYPMQKQLTQVRDTSSGSATLWQASPTLVDYELRLKQLLNTSPLQTLETGVQLTRIANMLWSESQQQRTATSMWNSTLNIRAQNSPQLRGYRQTQQDLRSFAELLIEREKNKQGLTLSYIKTVIYQAERELNRETPLEYLLTQYQDAKAHQQNTEALEKEISDRLNAMLSRWLLMQTGNPGNDFY